MLGALGELELAERYLRSAETRPKLYDHDVRRARFVFEARRGEVGDVDAQLEVTRPAEWWRVLLVSAVAHARAGRFEQARRLHDSAERELLGLGFGGFASLGERRAAEEFQELVHRGAVRGGAHLAGVDGGAAAPAGDRRRHVRAAHPRSSVARWWSRRELGSSTCRRGTRSVSSG